MDFTDLHERFVNLSKPLEPIDTDTIPTLHPIEGIRVIAYDFYGTLFISGVGDIGIDDGNVNAGLLTETLENSGIKILDKNAGSDGFKIYNEVVEEQIQNLKQNGIEYPEPDIRTVWKEVLEIMEEKNLIEYPKGDSIQNVVSVEFEARMNPVWPMSDAVETLKYFKEKGFVQGIISNSQFYTPIVLEALTEHSLDELGFEEKLLHWSFEENLKKPGLQFYRDFIDKLKNFDKDLDPSDVLYVGNDMLKDVYPAHELGMKTALFAGDKRSLKWREDDTRCKDIIPDLIITSLSQLKSFVKL
ncbi:HAD family hydrolase [Rhodohalobacter sp. 614A]|uniref:HAD family hydrolase n=1 Tax=Rhodohalobacter sp. 614A TaxID=2908649 RepID=UPI001F2A09AA|nr:HAD family hydrolase [Rhodohalobacter sp. 614A]